jgi:hypothetical protein
MYHPKGWANAKPLVAQRFFLCGLMNLILNLSGALGNVLMSPFSIFRSGVLRQGFDKFYSVSFQARQSFFISLLTPREPES